MFLVRRQCLHIIVVCDHTISVSKHMLAINKIAHHGIPRQILCIHKFMFWMPRTWYKRTYVSLSTCTFNSLCSIDSRVFNHFITKKTKNKNSCDYCIFVFYHTQCIDELTLRVKLFIWCVIQLSFISTFDVHVFKQDSGQKTNHLSNVFWWFLDRRVQW
jgi:hypothetical protein